MKISVVTAVWNRRATIQASITSTQAQSWPNREHVIQNGGSTDGTLEIVRELADHRTALVGAPDDGTTGVMGGDAPAVKPSDVLMRINPKKFPPGRGGSAVRRSDEGARDAGLGARDHRAGHVCRDGRRGSAGSKRPCFHQGKRFRSSGRSGKLKAER